MNEFFSHETLPYPPALSKSGDMRSGNKSLLLSCIKPLENVPTISQVDGAVLEGSMIANMTKPKKNQNFKSYCCENFYSQVKKYQKDYNAERIDVVFLTYKTQTSKAATRTRRDKGICRKVQDDSIAPTNWHAFLHLDENK